jgi:hypothetical protein
LIAPRLIARVIKEASKKRSRLRDLRDVDDAVVMQRDRNKNLTVLLIK